MKGIIYGHSWGHPRIWVVPSRACCSGRGLPLPSSPCWTQLLQGPACLMTAACPPCTATRSRATRTRQTPSCLIPAACCTAVHITGLDGCSPAERGHAISIWSGVPPRLVRICTLNATRLRSKRRVLSPNNTRPTGPPSRTANAHFTGCGLDLRKTDLMLDPGSGSQPHPAIVSPTGSVFSGGHLLHRCHPQAGHS